MIRKKYYGEKKCDTNISIYCILNFCLVLISIIYSYSS
jgi:hypothetical protein